MKTDPLNPVNTIRALNDAFRKEPHRNGHLMITHGIQELGIHKTHEILKLVSKFDQFNEDNDPYHEHDFGSLDYEGAKIFWKIDYYALDRRHGSENPADPSVTARVMTIMLAEEY